MVDGQDGSWVEVDTGRKRNEFMATMAEKAGTKSCQVGKAISSAVLT